MGYLTGSDGVEDGRGMGFLDADQDGDLDIAINNYLQPARLLINQAPRENHWIRFRLQGTRSNRSAIGARVVLEHGARRQVREVTSTAGYLSGQSLTLHFGLGLDREVDRVTVRWPSGTVEELRNLRADQMVLLIEGQVEPGTFYSKK